MHYYSRQECVNRNITGCKWLFFSGGIRILKLDDNFKEMQPVALLSGGHTATVRTVLWSTGVS